MQFPSPIRKLAAQGEEVRRLLAATASDAGVWRQETDARLRAGEPPFTDQILRGASKADRLVRASAGIWQTELSPWSDPASDPVAQLHRLDLRTLLLWQAKRTLDDFWGPARNDPAEPSYFDVVAAEYLASAKDLCKTAVAARYGTSDLAKLLADRRTAAHNLVRASPRDVQLVPGDPTAEVDVSVGRSASKDLPLGDLPPGEAAVYLERETDERVVPAFASAADAEKAGASGLRREPIAVPGVPGDASKRSRWVRASDLAAGQDQTQGRNYQAVSLYRGHVLDVSFTVIDSSGVQIVYQPPRDPKTFVTVKGSLKTESYVIFILDYSGSMTRRIGGEGSKHRFEDARDTLVKILREIGQIHGSPYRVGVMVYGHRVVLADSVRAMKRQHPEAYKDVQVPASAKLLHWDHNAGAFVAADAVGIQPSADIELVWPPRREGGWPPQSPFTDADAKRIGGLLTPLYPHGETPLYLAIMDAVDLLRQAGGSESSVAPTKHIVVITDGMNDQSDPTVRKDKKSAMAKFAAAGADVRLDMIEYSFNKSALQDVAEEMGVSEAEARKAVEDFESLATEHGGKAYSALATSELEDSLRRSLRLSRFTVAREQPSPGAATNAESKPVERDLGVSQPISLSAADREKPGGVPFTVKLVGAPQPVQSKLWLEGGESIVLHLSEDGSRLEHARYDENLRKFRPDVRDPLDPARRLYIAAHEPEEKDGVRFLFSIQNGDARLFSPRPAEAWVEIRPVLKDAKTAPVYIFYDQQFQPDRPVPVLECIARNWPKEADQAEARLWCKFTKTPPDEELRLDQTPKARPGVRLEITEKPDAKQGRYEVTVIERYTGGESASPPQFATLKIEMAPSPLEAVHHYIREAGEVRHTFTYLLDPLRAGQVPPYVVRVTPRERLIDQAVAVDPPLSIDIPRYIAPAR